GIADDMREAVVEDRVVVARDQLLVGHCLRARLFGLEEADHLGKDAGILEEIGADLVADCLTLGGVEFGRGRGCGEEERGEREESHGIWTSVESASGARYHVLRLLPAGRTLRQHGGGALGVAERIGETALESIAFGGGEGGEPLVPGTRPRKREVP